MTDHLGHDIPNGFLTNRMWQATRHNGWSRLLRERGCDLLYYALLRYCEDERLDPRKPLSLPLSTLMAETGWSKPQVLHARAALRELRLISYVIHEETRKAATYRLRPKNVFLKPASSKATLPVKSTELTSSSKLADPYAPTDAIPGSFARAEGADSMPENEEDRTVPQESDPLSRTTVPDPEPDPTPPTAPPSRGDGPAFPKPTMRAKKTRTPVRTVRDKVPAGWMRRVVEQHMEANPDFEYQTMPSQPFRKLVEKYLDMGGEIENVLALMANAQQKCLDGGLELPKFLQYYEQPIREMIQHAKAHGGSAPITFASQAPTQPKWKEVHALLDGLNKRYGEQVNTQYFGAQLQAAGLAEYVLGDERTLGVLLARFHRKFPASDTEDLRRSFLVALGAPVEKRRVVEDEERVVGEAVSVAEGLRETIERLRRKSEAKAASPPPKVEPPPVPPEVLAFRSLTAEELLDRIEPVIADELRRVNAERPIPIEELRTWAKEVPRSCPTTSTPNATPSAASSSTGAPSTS